MDWIVIFIIAGVVISVVGGILWWLFVIFIVGSAMRAAQRNLEANLRQLDAMIRQAQQGKLDPKMQQQIMSQWMVARSQMGQLDDIHRQRYDTRMGELMSMASEAGIDFDPYS